MLIEATGELAIRVLPPAPGRRIVFAGGPPESATHAILLEGEIAFMNYSPQPIDTSQASIAPELQDLVEFLARNVHDAWARARMDEGWRYGPRRDDEHKRHPGLVPYEQLSETEKEYDRRTALQTIACIQARGYVITRKS